MPYRRPVIRATKRKMAGEEQELSAEQTEKLVQFQDLTGIEEMARCREILQRHNWDMEVAVQSRFNEAEGTPQIYHDQRRELRTPPVDAHPTDQSVFTVSRARPRGVFGWSYFIVMFPFRFVYSTVTDILRFVYRLLRPDPRRYVTDPVGDVMRFIQKFDEDHGILHPTFYQGTYSQALNDAKRDLRFLLVYLHGDDHQDTPEFCRNTLCNPDLAEYINTQVIFWACNTNSPEGFRVSQALRENTYPFLALVVLRDNKMTVVARIEGPMGAEDLITRLNRLIENNQSSLIAARADREERNLNQSIREQQDAAYLQSLWEDQEKERKKREEREAREKEEQEQREMQLMEEKRLEEIEKRKEEIRNQLPQEPDSDDPDVIRVLIKLPNGMRLDRRFIRHQSLKHLYNYVFVHEAGPDDFQIVTNFPRRTLPCQPTDEVPEPPTFEEAGLGKSEMVFVHDNEA